MQIEYAFLRSRVACRVFVLFILCALLPVGALSLVSLTDVTSQLTQQAERRVRQESKAMGMAMYQRLLLLEAELLSTIAQRREGLTAQTGEVPAQVLPSLPGFVGMASVSEDGEVSVFLGELRTIPALSQAQRALLRQNKTLLMVEPSGPDQSRFFLSRISDVDGRVVVAELNHEFLWDLGGSMTLPAETSMCVFGQERT